MSKRIRFIGGGWFRSLEERTEYIEKNKEHLSELYSLEYDCENDTYDIYFYQFVEEKKP